jgi:conjugal transfer ATP-binding protein TraC
VTLSAVSKPAQKAAGELATNRAKLEQSEKSGFSKFVADFGGKRDEIARLAEEVDAGERIFETMYTVTCFVEGGKEQARQAITEMGKIYRRVGFNLNPERYLQLPIFIGSLPFGMTSEHMNTFKKVQRMRILKGKAVAGLAPVHGEWSGNSNGDGLLLLGRQGQTFCWNNFISNGNYNTAIVGKSGAGKSVLMQEIVTSVYANGGRVLVIDDGYSFKNSCDILGGAHIAFDGSTTLRLNPFSMLQADRMDTAEYSAEALELITRVVSSMASLGVQREGRVSGVEEQYITDAIKDVWDDKGADGEITDVYRRLLDKSEKEERLIDVCSRLKAFTRDGIYGPYFEGRSNVSIDNAFTVVELSDVKNQPSLEEVILQIIMFLGTELMYKTERNVPVVILMDEAWDMLKGEGTAAFIEGVVRRARKYTGALITGTQSIDDYYSNPASEVCLANSDWLIVMAQKDEVIDRMASQQKMSIDPGIAPVLKSITSVPGQFSELAIRGDSGWAFGRLVLDPFSLAVFSSKGDTVEHLRRRRESGMSVTDAIEDMIKKGVVS